MLECITPILSVKNLAASIDYYVNRLGFKKEWDWGDPPDFGAVSRDNWAIMMCQGGQGKAGTHIWIGVQDVDECYKEFKAGGATIRKPPTNYPWACEMLVEDLDGHVLRIGSEPKED